MRILWLMLIVASLGLVGCACDAPKMSDTGKHATKKADCSTGEQTSTASVEKSACDHEGPCTDACHTDAPAEKAACDHEGPCTDACKS